VAGGLGGRGVQTVVAHDSYLINLAAPSDAVRGMSMDAFADELTRCAQVGIAGLVTHPGSHNGDGEARGLARVAESLDAIYDRLGGCQVRTLLEITAGQGTNLGYRFEHLAEIMAAAPSTSRWASAWTRAIFSPRLRTCAAN